MNLHAYEFDDGATPDLYRADLPGADVTTNWLRPPWVVSDDPTILVRQILQILDHRRVVSNCLTTALLYAAYLGRDARLLRHPARRKPPTEGRGLALHEELEQATDGEPLRAIAGPELGADHLRTPDELAGGDGLGLGDAHRRSRRGSAGSPSAALADAAPVALEPVEAKPRIGRALRADGSRCQPCRSKVASSSASGWAVIDAMRRVRRCTVSGGRPRRSARAAVDQRAEDGGRLERDGRGSGAG